jgi:flavin reductase (DIM6/NTAB) family NADH-FMN oxidoreductase RutF
MMGLLWSPIAAVTSQWCGKANAQIAVAVAAASIVPSMPRVIAQIYKRNYSHELIYRSGAFAVNFLRKDQLHLIKDFGLVSGRQVDKLSGIAYQVKASGSPILEDCWGYLDCRVVNAMDGGDMTCFLAEVLDGETRSEGEPLWWRYARRELPAEWLEQWNRQIAAEIEYSKEQMKHIDYTPWTLVE